MAALRPATGLAFVFYYGGLTAKSHALNAIDISEGRNHKSITSPQALGKS